MSRWPRAPVAFRSKASSPSLITQPATKLVIEPVFEADFLDCSHGFRPRRSALEAREQVRTHIQRERRHVVVDADIRGFFDSLDRGLLRRALRQRLSDRRVLALIDSSLCAGVIAEGELLHPEAGTPQGGVISPLLANVYLHALDRAWQERHWRLGKLTPYADDLVIVCWKRGQARRALAALGRLMATLGSSSPLRRPGSSTSRWRARGLTSSATTSAASRADVTRPRQHVSRNVVVQEWTLTATHRATGKPDGTISSTATKI